MNTNHVRRLQFAFGCVFASVLLSLSCDRAPASVQTSQPIATDPLEQSRAQIAAHITAGFRTQSADAVANAVGDRGTTLQVTSIRCPGIFDSVARIAQDPGTVRAGYLRVECLNPSTTQTVSLSIAQILATPAAPTAVARAAVPRENDGQVAARLASLSGENLIGALWELEGRVGPPVSFAQLERSTARYDGTAAIFTGEVLEIQDVPDSTGSFLRLGLNYEGTRVLAVFALARPGDDVVRGHRVRVYGTLRGDFTYHSQAGWDITIPKINALAVVRDNVPRRAARPPR